MKLEKQNEASGARDQITTPVAPCEEFISKREVASRLKMTVRNVSKWQRRGIIPYIKCGRAVLFKWADVEAHLKQAFSANPHTKQNTKSNYARNQTSPRIYRIPVYPMGRRR
jgi:excisionase family DNA binding protein